MKPRISVITLGVDNLEGRWVVYAGLGRAFILGPCLSGPAATG